MRPKEVAAVERLGEPLKSQELAMAEELVILRRDVIDLVQHEAGPLEKGIVWFPRIFWLVLIPSVYVIGTTALEYHYAGRGWATPLALAVGPLIALGTLFFLTRKQMARLRELKENYPYAFEDEPES